MARPRFAGDTAPDGIEKRHDEDAVSAASLVRRLRWRRRFALPGAARNPQLLVSDLAGAAGGTGARQQADRRTAGADGVGAGGGGGAGARVVRDPYLDAV